MQKKFYLVPVLAFSTVMASAQYDSRHGRDGLDMSFAFGSSEGTGSFSYVHNWGLGKSRRLELGMGLRLTNYLGERKEFYTAPGKYARTTTFPFAIVVAGHVEKNIDTFTVKRPLTSALNLTLNAGYRLSRKWYGGLNIDLLGVTAGRKSEGTLQSSGTTLTEPSAKPSAFNLLLTGDNDLGSLNSEFFIRYNVAPRIDVKVVYQFAFSEYKTRSIHQVTPDGGDVYRFRNKANLFGAGVAFYL